ncbi:MAG: DNA polymerase/3'-5' exonuclease PolX [Gemmatimonadetes bacterium]|nr:DNA polymerase/3'-5' exonuclease PolX [Gemmatimonadota bacterium]
MTEGGVENAEVARLLEEMADVLALAQANPFRVRAYRRAARLLATLDRPVSALVAAGGEAALDALPGIGADLAGKIAAIARTGRFAALEAASRAVPRGARALLRVPGIGPQRARLLAERLGITSVAELVDAARRGAVRALPGFGVVLERTLRREAEALAAAPARLPRAVAAPYAEALVAWMRAGAPVREVAVGGSFRRARDTVGDLDLLVAARPADADAVAARFTAFPETATVLARGATRCAIRLRRGVQVDLRIVPPASWGSALHYFTGSTAHNIAVRRLARARGLTLNEYGLFRGRRRVAGRTEAELFAALGLAEIPPELREDRGEIEAAQAGRLPRLLTQEDVRGDLQCHTTASDGRDPLEAMAEAALARGYEYLAVTDHTPAVRVARGMDRAGFRRQRRAIDAWNARGTALTLLAGAEVDILADGALDLDDATLAGLDVVLVSLHTRLGLPAAQQTRRVVRALRHPSVDILAHPTGRLLGGRAGARFDFAEVCRVARGEGVMLEVNAHPERLDLDDAMVRTALEHGVRLTLGTDAHAVAELGAMHWGVDQARRGWATAADVANTRPLPALRALLHRGR